MLKPSQLRSLSLVQLLKSLATSLLLDYLRLLLLRSLKLQEQASLVMLRLRQDQLCSARSI